MSASRKNKFVFYDGDGNYIGKGEDLFAEKEELIRDKPNKKHTKEDENE
ncbi:hypothetical protein [Salicibibacter halophilus]|nr:hypothetical protein [Salicibibacter halophilus]